MSERRLVILAHFQSFVRGCELPGSRMAIASAAGGSESVVIRAVRLPASASEVRSGAATPVEAGHSIGCCSALSAEAGNQEKCVGHAPAQGGSLCRPGGTHHGTY